MQKVMTLVFGNRGQTEVFNIPFDQATVERLDLANGHFVDTQDEEMSEIAHIIFTIGHFVTDESSIEYEDCELMIERLHVGSWRKYLANSREEFHSVGVFHMGIE